MAVYDGAAWQDRILNAYPPASDGERYYKIIAVDGTVVQEAVKLQLLNTVLPGNEGTPVNAGNLNKIIAAIGTATLSGDTFVMTMLGFSLFDGVKVRVKFNAAKSYPIKLNINGSGAKEIDGVNAVKAGEWGEFIYNATTGKFVTVFSSSSSVRPGTITFFPQAAAPEGYLFCNGATVATADYPVLYSVIGTMFGGNATNFALPDLRNQFLRGISSGLSPATNLGTKYGATSIPYFTNQYMGIPTSTASNADSDNSTANTLTSWSMVETAGQYTKNPSYRIATVRPANMGLLPCIKY